MEVREAELLISVDLERPCLQGHLPPMADYQELCWDLGHAKTPSTITLYGRDISNKIPTNPKIERKGGGKDGKKRIFFLSLTLYVSRFGRLGAMAGNLLPSIESR